jgi:rubrerythrin
MVKKRGANQHTGKPFIEWCAENGKRGERLANEFREELPTELTYASNYKAKWKCLKCKHVWRARVCNRTRSDKPRGCPKCASNAQASKTNNFLAWCEKNGELGKKLSREYVDKDKPPTAVTKGATYKAKWKCGRCSYEWRAKLYHRTTSNRPSGCPECNPTGPKQHTKKRRRGE